MTLTARNYMSYHADRGRSERATIGLGRYERRARYLLDWRLKYLGGVTLGWTREAYLLIRAGMLNYGEKWRQTYVSRGKVLANVGDFDPDAIEAAHDRQLSALPAYPDHVEQCPFCLTSLDEQQRAPVCVMCGSTPSDRIMWGTGCKLVERAETNRLRDIGQLFQHKVMERLGAILNPEPAES